MKATKIDAYWLFNEDESYQDFKIPRQDIRFPSHEGEQLNGEVHTYDISELEVNKK